MPEAIADDKDGLLKQIDSKKDELKELDSSDPGYIKKRGKILDDIRELRKRVLELKARYTQDDGTEERPAAKKGKSFWDF